MAETTINPAVELNEVAVDGKSFKDIVKSIILDGGKKVTNLTVRNVNAEEKLTKDGEIYTRFAFTIDKPIRGFVTNPESGIVELGTSRVIFVSSIALGAILRENPELGWVGNHIAKHPQAASLIFSGAKLDIIQQDVPMGTSYINPFSTKKDAVGDVFDSDKIINHIINVTPSAIGERMLDKLATSLLVG